MPGTIEMDVPAELKPIQAFLQRASEVRHRDPFMAYQCRLYAAQLGFQLLKEQGGEGGERFIIALLDDLEARKGELQGHPALSDDHAATVYVLEFGLRVFAGADADDRRTAKAFIAAGNFLETIKVYGSLPEDVEDKIKYAKWRAAEIIKQEQSLPSFSGKFPAEMSKSATDLEAAASHDIPDRLPPGYRPSGTTVDPQLLTRAEKYAKQAVSAILFEDIPSAIQCLETALDVLKTK